MEIKVSLRATGISDAESEYWKTMYYRYNRIHVPLEGRAFYYDGSQKRILNEGMAYQSYTIERERDPYYYQHLI